MSTPNSAGSPEIADLIARAARVLAQLEAWLPPAPPPVDWAARAYRWRKRGASHGWLDAIAHVSVIHTDDLQHIDRQKGVIERNTLHFLEGKPANNVLMTGARGTGKHGCIVGTVVGNQQQTIARPQLAQQAFDRGQCV